MHQELIKSYPGYCLGYRIWNIDIKCSKIESPLFSQNCQWKFGEAANAELPQYIIDNPEYFITQSSGFYALSELKYLKQYHMVCSSSGIGIRNLLVSGRRVVVIGQVKLWGLVARYTEGYRAQYAYPSKFYLHKKASIEYESAVRRLASKYKAVVEFLPHNVEAVIFTRSYRL